MADPVIDRAWDELMRRSVPVQTVGSVDDAYRTFGESQAEQHRGLTNALLGRPVSARPPRDADERRRYRSTMRSVQRYRTSAAERRALRGSRLDRVIAAARERATTYGVRTGAALVSQRGCRMILSAWIQVSQVCEFAVMPAPVGGARWAHIDAEDAQDALEAWAAGDLPRAGDELLYAFWVAYWDRHPGRARGTAPAQFCGSGVESCLLDVG